MLTWTADGQFEAMLLLFVCGAGENAVRSPVIRPAQFAEREEKILTAGRLLNTETAPADGTEQGQGQVWTSSGAVVLDIHANIRTVLRIGRVYHPAVQDILWSGNLIVEI